MEKTKITATLLAIMAAVFYAINMPISKRLLEKIEPAFLASFLYFGAGIGIGLIFVLRRKHYANREDNLSFQDLPYVIGMIALDIAAPILLMIGLTRTTASNASLLNNFEIVATSVIALIVFKEMISRRLWFAILLITFSNLLLSIENLSSLTFSYGSALILAAAICWGFENNFTRKISGKNTFQIVILKGIFSGLGSFIVALINRNDFPRFQDIAYALCLGFVAYGLSIFFYVKAQKDLGAAKTSAYYAIAPFVGTMLSFVILKEAVTVKFILALLVMATGSGLLVIDTLVTRHTHLHTHTFVHTHCGIPDCHSLKHSHDHKHFLRTHEHEHEHPQTHENQTHDHD